MEEISYFAVFDNEIENILQIEKWTRLVAKRVIFLNATNVQEALKVARENYIHLCFISLTISEKDRKEIIKYLKNKNKKIRIIALNSIGKNPEVVKKEMGFHSCIEVGLSSFGPHIKSAVIDFVFNTN